MCPGDEILTHPAGRVSFSPDPDEPHYVGTVATFTCEGGYVLLPVEEGGSTRTCEIGGWSGTNPTCSKLLVFLFCTEGFMQGDLPPFKSVQVY